MKQVYPFTEEEIAALAYVDGAPAKDTMTVAMQKLIQFSRSLNSQVKSLSEEYTFALSIPTDLMVGGVPVVTKLIVTFYPLSRTVSIKEFDEQQTADQEGS